MSENPAHPDRIKHLAAFLSLLTAVIIAAVAALQNGANVTASTANRDSQLLSLQVSDEFEKLGLQANFEMAVIAQSYKDLQEAQVLRLTALDLETRGNAAEAAAARARAEVLLARAQREKQFSSLYKDTNYAPNAADKLPEIQKYINDLQLTRTRLAERLQNVNRRYALASRMADGYTLSVTVLAVALFLFGLSQALDGRIRLPFIAFGAAAAVAGAGGALLIFLS